MARRRKSSGNSPSHGSSLSLVTTTVVRVLGQRVLVMPPDDGLLCSVRKSLLFAHEEKIDPVAVGDQVRIRVSADGAATVEDVLPRRRYLSRLRAVGGHEQVVASNVDQVAIVASVLEPDFRPRLIDRILVASERGGFVPTIVLTKLDLLPERELITWAVDLYRGLGYGVHLVSVKTGEGLEDLRKELLGKTTVMAGHSGVGKSSLLNAIEPTFLLRTQTISEKWGKGRHTTSGAILLPLTGGGAVVDTPGVRAFALAGLEKSDIGVFFREFTPFIDACKMRSCTHDHEPSCAVASAASSGTIDPRRYESYLRILHGDDDGH